MNTHSKPKHWWNEPLRVLDLVYCPQVAELDYEELGRRCQEFHANVIHFQFHRETRGGFDPDEVYCRNRVATRQNRDVLAEFLPIAKKIGVRVVLYVNGHWFTRKFVDQHPDWAVIKEDGERMNYLYGDDDSTFCINSPWREWMHGRIEDLCAYDIDGLFWDGPLFFLNRKGCYCRWCREKFRKMFGKKMPKWDRQNREGWRLLREFAVTSLTDYYRDAYGWVKAINPELAVYLNAANVAEASWVVGHDSDRQLPYTDILAAEGGFHYGRVSGNLWKTSASSKFYETQARGKPALNAVSSADSPWRRCQLSGAEMRILLANASRGVNPYAAFFYEGMGQSGDAATKEVFHFLEKNEEYQRETRSAARAALLVSKYTLDNYEGVDIPWADLSGVKAEKSEAPGNHNASFYGYYEMLVRSRIPFDLLDDKAIESGRLSSCQLLILPTAACMSRKECDEIARFVRRGGRLIADFETSHYDEHGRRLKKPGLARVFGVSSLNEVAGPRRWDFAQVKETCPSLAGLEIPTIPATRHNLRVKPTTATTRIVFSAPIPSTLPDTITYTNEPFLVENRVGKGKCFYFPGTFGDLFKERQFPSYQKIMEGIIEHETAPLVRIDGAAHLLEVNLRDQPSRRRRLVHLVNYEISGIDHIVPATGVRITVATSQPARGVRALRLEKNLRFQQKAGKVSFILPRLEEFEIVAIDP
jgi:hypothetical protein